MIVFGGQYGSLRLNDVWQLSMSWPAVWTELQPSGEPPAARFGHSMVLDSFRNRIIVFGGVIGGTPYVTNDVWILGLGAYPAWSLMAVVGMPPQPREGASLIYDPIRDRLIMYGGRLENGGYDSQTWQLTLGASPTWTQLVPVGPTYERAYHQAIYDPIGDRMVVFGGRSGSTNPPAQLAALALSGTPTWVNLSASGTAPNVDINHSLVYDSVAERALVFGGSKTAYSNGTWGLSLRAPLTWSVVAPAEPAPAARFGHLCLFDPQHRSMLVIGGSPAYDCVKLDLAAGERWTSLPAMPTPRRNAAGAYDVLRNRAVVFGGYCPIAPFLRTDVWVLDHGATAWAQLTTAGIPPPGGEYRAGAYDPVRDRFLVSGRLGTNPDSLAVWSLEFDTNTWSRLPTAGSLPPPRLMHTAVYDPAGDRMIIFGGQGLGLGATNDCWALSLSGTPTWTLLTAPGPRPPARWLHSAVIDPLQQRMVIFGGTGLGYLADTWAFSMATNQWTDISALYNPLVPREGHAAVCDPTLNRMIVFGGYTEAAVVLGDYWQLRWSAFLESPPAKPPVTVSVQTYPNPGRLPFTFTLDLPGATHVSADVFDVAGRLRASLIRGMRSGGRHRFNWSPRSSETQAGLYFLRVVSDYGSTTHRFVVLE